MMRELIFAAFLAAVLGLLYLTGWERHPNADGKASIHDKWIALDKVAHFAVGYAGVLTAAAAHVDAIAAWALMSLAAWGLEIVQRKPRDGTRGYFSGKDLVVGIAGAALAMLWAIAWDVGQMYGDVGPHLYGPPVP